VIKEGGDASEPITRTSRLLKTIGTAAVTIVTLLAAVTAVNLDRATGEVSLPLWVVVVFVVGLLAVVVASVVFMYFETRKVWEGIAYWRGEAANLENIVSNLEDLAYYDPITGLRNANALDRQLSGGSNENRCLILLDLRNFGSVNKKHSHWKGDEYLRNFSSMISQDSRRNEYIYKNRPKNSRVKGAASTGAPTDAVQAFRRNDGGDEFYILLRGSVIDGLGYLNRLHGRARAFDDMAERVLGAPHPFGFRAGMIALGKSEAFDDATVRVTQSLARTTKAGSEALVDWGRIEGDDKTPVDFDDPRFPRGSTAGNILAQAKNNFLVGRNSTAPAPIPSSES
jgi:hypothetical protein